MYVVRKPELCETRPAITIATANASDPLIRYAPIIRAR